MPINFYCTQCGQSLTIPDDTGSSVARCPFCQAVVDVPSTPAPVPTPASVPAPWKPPADRFYETGNPFQSPVEIEEEPYIKGELVASRIDFNKLLNDVFALYGRHFGIMILLGGIALGASFVFNLLSNASQAFLQVGLQHNETMAFLGFLAVISIGILQQLVNFWLGIGAMRMILDLARGGQEIKFGLILPPIGLSFRCLASTILQNVVTSGALVLVAPPLIWVWFSVQQAGGGPPPDITLPVVLSIVFGIAAAVWMWYFGARLYFADMFIIDRNEGIIESIASNWKFTRGNALTIMVGMILFGICMMSGLLLCCIGIFLTWAFYPAFTVLAYLQMTGQPYIYSPGFQRQ